MTTHASPSLQTLVAAHVDLVYAAALRQLRDPHLADDVTQTVFLILARRIDRLPPPPALPAWLLKVTRYTSLTALRAHRRRLHHESLAAVGSEVSSPHASSAHDADLAALLDEALMSLAEADRQLITLRYLQNKSLPDVAALLRLRDNTAAKRSQRALQKLRAYFLRRGLTLSDSALAAFLPTTLLAAPSHLAPHLLSAAATAHALTPLPHLSWKLRLMTTSTKLKAAAAITLLALASGTIWIATRPPIASPTPAIAALPAPTPPPATAPSAATAPSLPPALQAKVDDLLYQIRFTHVTTDPAPAYLLVRQLVAIGKPAVPSLIAELDRTTADTPMRVLIFTLRVIDDPRAIPALIRAIPRTAVLVSDFGNKIKDRDLWAFVNDHRNEKKYPTVYPDVSIYRANTEIMFALQQMTHHSIGRGSIWGAKNSDPDNIALAHELRQTDADTWQDWWNDNAATLLSPEDLAVANAPVIAGDPVAAAHESSAGQLFPTGPTVRLSAPVEMFIEDVPPFSGKVGQPCVNLATGKRYSFREAQFDLSADPHAVPTTSPAIIIDVWSLPAFDMHTPRAEMMSGDFTHATHELDASHMQIWSIPNDRWNTLDAEIQNPAPLHLGKWGVATGFTPLDPDTGEYHLQYPATFLFITQQHAHGILQIMGTSKTPSGLRFRYRLWSTDAAHLPLLPSPQN
jgi:RNA polymerase sigma factor (sigma-70 family)